MNRLAGLVAVFGWCWTVLLVDRELRRYGATRRVKR